MKDDLNHSSSENVNFHNDPWYALCIAIIESAKDDYIFWRTGQHLFMKNKLKRTAKVKECVLAWKFFTYPSSYADQIFAYCGLNRRSFWEGVKELTPEWKKVLKPVDTIGLRRYHDRGPLAQ